MRIFLTEFGTAENPVKIGGDVPSDSGNVRLVFVGNSHATRLAAAAKKMAIQNAVVTLPGNKITAAAAEQLCDVLSNSDVRTIGVFQTAPTKTGQRCYRQKSVVTIGITCRGGWRSLATTLSSRR
jgi:hypothetical protein